MVLNQIEIGKRTFWRGEAKISDFIPDLQIKSSLLNKNLNFIVEVIVEVIYDFF